MKKSPFSLIFLLICALALSLNGVLHPCIHHHDSCYSDEGTILSVPMTKLHNPADESFCPLCSGMLNGLEWNDSAPAGTSAGKVLHSARPEYPPPPFSVQLPPVRGPPHSA